VAATHLAFDDTDSLDGMCTTYLAVLMIREISDYDLIGLPRLVRLNPNVPWKTRGNAAICMDFGVGVGRKIQIGDIDEAPVFSYMDGQPAAPDRIFKAAERIIRANAHFECKSTNPGLLVSVRRPDASFYWDTVREIIEIKAVKKEISRINGISKGFKNGRGLIGSAAAMAWRPADRTYELLAYRKPELVGTKRQIDAASVIKMDTTYPSTFHNIDRISGHIAITPGSPCPILFGIRGDNPIDLLRAKDIVRSESPSSWLVFLTNQGTDEHLTRRKIKAVKKREGVILNGEVSREPNTIEGGHVFFEMRDPTGTITCAVYEPSGDMRVAARTLRLGDKIVAYGSVREHPFEINVEKMNVIRLNQNPDKVENPVCEKCGKHMKSIGRNAGYRCRKCGTRVPPSAARTAPRLTPKIGWYEPPIASRRHLYKPVKRFGIKRSPIREILNRFPHDEASAHREDT